MTRVKGILGVVVLVGTVTSVAAAEPSRSPALARSAFSTIAPLAGVVAFQGVRIPGATVVIRGLSPGLELLVWVLRTEKDGSFVWPGAPAGTYAVSAFSGASKASASEVRHGTSDAAVSFVSLEFDRDPRLVPETAPPRESPWTARAIQSADPLRETAAPETAPAAKTHDPLASPQAVTSLERLPVRATVASVAGKDISAGNSSVSRTSIDVGGNLSSSLRWGLEGEYGSISNLQGTDGGDIRRLALEIASAPAQAGSSLSASEGFSRQGGLRVETRRQALPLTAIDASFSEHRMDCLIPSGESTSAAVSARLVSQENLFVSGPVPDLFARQSNALEIQARYKADVSDSTYLRAAAAYRSDMATEPLLARPDGSIREARLSAGAGTNVNSWLLIEGNVSGDYSTRARSLTPEVALKASLSRRMRVILSVSQRFESDFDPFIPYGQSGSEDADLTRSARAVYRGGVLFSSARGDTLFVEGVHRKMASTFQYLLDRNFIEALDALYLFDGDSMEELGVTGTVRIADAVHGRISFRGGFVEGSAGPAIAHNEARFGQGEASVRVIPSQTDVALRYRYVDQSLSRSILLLHNNLEAVEISLSQALPLPLLRQIGSEWRAIVAVEFAERQSRADVVSSRRVSGGFGLSF
jgi:hypothetical protein